MAKQMKSERQRLLQKIHIGAKQLGLDDETYRNMLWTVARARSCKQLDAHGLNQVLQHLVSRGFRVKKPITARAYPGRTHNTDNEPQLKKIEALLTDMSLPWSYADSIAEQMFQIKKVAWLKSPQWGAVIAALTNKQHQEKQ